jgi:hypothetical protein
VDPGGDHATVRRSGGYGVDPLFRIFPGIFGPRKVSNEDGALSRLVLGGKVKNECH